MIPTNTKKALLRSLYSAFFFVGSTVFFYFFSKAETFSDRILTLSLGAFTTLFAVGTALWTLVVDDSGKKPMILLGLAAGLWLVLSSIAFQRPDDYFNIVAGVLASLIIAVASSKADWAS